MKKFLRWDLFSASDVPVSVEKSILATAAMRAAGFKRKRRVMLFAMPSAAAAAAAMLVGGVVYYNTLFTSTTPLQLPGTDAATATLSNSQPDMLALADMTALEQVNYTIALVSENNFDEDNFVI